MNAKMKLFNAWRSRLFDIDEAKINDYAYGEYEYLFDYINPNFAQMDTDELIVWHAKLAVVCRYMGLKGYAEGHIASLFYLSLLRLRNKEKDHIGDDEFSTEAIKKMSSTADLYRLQIISHGQQIVKCRQEKDYEGADMWLKGLFDNTALLMGKEYYEGDKTFGFVLCHFLK